MSDGCVGHVKCITHSTEGTEMRHSSVENTIFFECKWKIAGPLIKGGRRLFVTREHVWLYPSLLFNFINAYIRWSYPIMFFFLFWFCVKAMYIVLVFYCSLCKLCNYRDVGPYVIEINHFSSFMRHMGLSIFLLLLLCDFEKGLLPHVLIIGTDLLNKEAIPSFIYCSIRHSFISVPIKIGCHLESAHWTNDVKIAENACCRYYRSLMRIFNEIGR